MVYKFEDCDNGNELEIQTVLSNKIWLRTYDEETSNVCSITLNKESLYDLIGVLHSIQTKINKGGQNV